MKKYLLIALIFGVVLIVLPGKAQAQYNPFIYNGNAYLTRALAHQRARAAGRRAKGKRVVRRKAARKSYVRRTRRVSSLEITSDPRNTMNVLSSKKSDIV